MPFLWTPHLRLTVAAVVAARAAARARGVADLCAGSLDMRYVLLSSHHMPQRASRMCCLYASAVRRERRT